MVISERAIGAVHVKKFFRDRMRPCLSRDCVEFDCVECERIQGGMG